MLKLRAHICFVVLVLAVGASAAATVYATTNQPPNAIATVDAAFPSKKPQAGTLEADVRATLRLPPSPNKSWYAVWIMIAGRPWYESDQTFAQIGLIRRPKIDQRLRAFVAWAKENRPQFPSLKTTGLTKFSVHPAKATAMHYEEVGPVQDTVHEVAIRRHGTRFSLELDGHVVRNLQIDVGKSYAQVGGEASAENDTLSGIISDVEIASEYGKLPLDATTAKCIVSNFGARITPSNVTFTISGTYNRSRGLQDYGLCTGIP